MAAYGTADITYGAILGTHVGDPAMPMKGHAFTVSIAGGKTYPAGGLPLSLGQLGCPAAIIQWFWLDEGSSSGYVAKFDYTAVKIRLYEIADGGTIAFTSALTEVGTTETVAATTWKAFVRGW